MAAHNLGSERYKFWKCPSCGKWWGPLKLESGSECPDKYCKICCGYECPHCRTVDGDGLRQTEETHNVLRKLVRGEDP